MMLLNQKPEQKVGSQFYWPSEINSIKNKKVSGLGRNPDLLFWTGAYSSCFGCDVGYVMDIWQ